MSDATLAVNFVDGLVNRGIALGVLIGVAVACYMGAVALYYIHRKKKFKETLCKDCQEKFEFY